MSGKPTIPPEVNAYIRALYSQGASRTEIMADLGVSRYTVNKALDPDFIERERERQRALSPDRVAARRADPTYEARRKAMYFDCDEYREKARTRMRLIRARRKTAPAST